VTDEISDLSSVRPTSRSAPQAYPAYLIARNCSRYGFMPIIAPGKKGGKGGKTAYIKRRVGTPAHARHLDSASHHHSSRSHASSRIAEPQLAVEAPARFRVRARPYFKVINILGLVRRLPSLGSASQHCRIICREKHRLVRCSRVRLDPLDTIFVYPEELRRGACRFPRFRGEQGAALWPS